MSAIFKREFKTFFTSPIGYFVLAVLFGFSGFYFFATNMYAGSADLSGVFGGLFTIVLLLVLPVLTMRLLSDDKRQRTDQALLTAPVSLTGIALGKFLAALLLFAIGISITLVFAVIIAFQVTPDWLVIVGNYVGLLLLGGMVIAIGLFISSLTVSQIIAAIGTFIISVLLMYMDSLASVVSNEVLSTAIQWFSFNDRYSTFTQGMFSISSVIFFISVVAVFVFLTARKVESRRWS
mgnify:CR=1 FL=1